MLKAASILLIIIITLQAVSGAWLNCSESTPAECKKQTSELFNKKLKELHLEYFFGLVKKYLSVFKPLAEAPYDKFALKHIKHHSYVEKVKKLQAKYLKNIAYVEGHIEKMQANMNDDVVLSSVAKDTKWVMDSILFSAIDNCVNGLRNAQREVKTYDLAHIGKFETNFSKFYNEVFSELRPHDLDAYPAYKNIQAETLRGGNMEFRNIIKILDTEFDLPYVKAMRKKFMI